MEHWYYLAIGVLVFCFAGVFTISAFQPDFVQPLYDSVNFNNPFVVLSVLLLVIVLVFGWVAYKAEQSEGQRILAQLRR
jgi:hypothetical protein